MHRDTETLIIAQPWLVLFSGFVGNPCKKKKDKKTREQQLEVESLLAHVLAYDHQTLLDAPRRGWGGCSEGSGSLIPSSGGGKGWSGKTGGDEVSHTSSTFCSASQ